METQNNGPPSYVQQVLDYTGTKIAFTVILSLAAILTLFLLASYVEAQTINLPPNDPHSYGVLVGFPGNHRQGSHPLLL